INILRDPIRKQYCTPIPTKAIAEVDSTLKYIIIKTIIYEIISYITLLDTALPTIKQVTITNAAQLT
ncbi:5135_t:CDS:2, partial [Racocetra persica]